MLSIPTILFLSFPFLQVEAVGWLPLLREQLFERRRDRDKGDHSTSRGDALRKKDTVPWHPSRASRAGLLARTVPTSSPVTSRQAGGHGQVLSEGGAGRRPAAAWDSIGPHLHLEQLTWGWDSGLSFRGAPVQGGKGWRPEERWSEKIRTKGCTQRPDFL